MTANARRVGARNGMLAGALVAAVVTALGAPATSRAVGIPVIPVLPAISETVIMHDQAGIALLGYDPVAYFADGRAIGGAAAHELQHLGYVWRFASGANKAAFEATPEAYMPAFGGHDATAMAHGRAVDSEPRHFAIRAGQLFLFRNRESKERFTADTSLAETAHAQWLDVQRQLAR